MLPKIHEHAPDFKLPDQDGKVHSLADYRGRHVVLYFYPKDDTPGCTQEACNFRDDHSLFQQAGVAILGVSPDGVGSHAKFSAKFALPFPLLADEGHRVCEAYGVWGKKRMYGREYDGVFRTTFLIDPEGRIARVYENVKPAEHSRQILADLEG